jgi:apolipoprotein D and lipocalin family protein
MNSFRSITPGPALMRPWVTLALLLMVALLGLNACSTAIPAGVTAVTPFDVKRYEGTWYEIARLDHSFERGLSDVTANYRLQPDGSVKVVNRGYDVKKADWREVTGRALFIGEPNRGSLKVSFFGPFYGGYHVVALDPQNYRWAMVVGPSLDYYWILSRDKQLPAAIQEQLLEQAKRLGVDTQKVIRVEQTRHDR